MISAITPMVQCAKMVSMAPQDIGAANNWRKANKGVTVFFLFCIQKNYEDLNQAAFCFIQAR